MTRDEVMTICRGEENEVFRGWDFSRLDGREKDMAELPWDYGALVRESLSKDARVLDMETGGGEFIRSLGHPMRQIAVTEAYPPNIEICKRELVPLGAELAEIDPGETPLPFPDESFDLVINRHGAYIPEEIYRVLKPGGVFLTQQVGDQNNRTLSAKLIPDCESKYPAWKKIPHNAAHARAEFDKAGFEIRKTDEIEYESRYYDVGIVAYYAKIIEWEFPGFSTDACIDGLCKIQREIEEKGYASGNEHRFLLIAQKI